MISYEFYIWQVWVSDIIKYHNGFNIPIHLLNILEFVLMTLLGLALYYVSSKPWELLEKSRKSGQLPLK